MLKVLIPELIEIGKMDVNWWNANRQNELTFNSLSGKIEEGGFVGVVIAAPVELFGDELPEYLSGKDFVVAHGEHRFRAARMIDPNASLPVVVIGREFVDADDNVRERAIAEIKGQSSFHNLAVGEFDPIAFTKLYDEIKAKIGKKDAWEAMGVTSEKALSKHISRVRAQLPKDMQEKLDKARGEVKTVDDLSRILNNLLNEYGDDLEYSFMFFVYGKKTHLMVEMDKEFMDIMKTVTSWARQNKMNINEIMHNAVATWASSIDWGAESET